MDKRQVFIKGLLVDKLAVFHGLVPSHVFVAFPFAFPLYWVPGLAHRYDPVYMAVVLGDAIVLQRPWIAVDSE